MNKVDSVQSACCKEGIDAVKQSNIVSCAFRIRVPERPLFRSSKRHKVNDAVCQKRDKIRLC